MSCFRDSNTFLGLHFMQTGGFFFFRGPGHAQRQHPEEKRKMQIRLLFYNYLDSCRTGLRRLFI